MLDSINVKYFKLAVDKLKKDSATELSANCPACGENRGRLHLVNVPQEGYDYVKCWNGSCSLEEPTNIYKLLQMSSPELISSYKRETLHTKITDLKTERSLGDILKRVQAENPEVAKTNEPEIPLGTLFQKCKENEAATAYVKNRGFEPHDNWFFSEDKFFEANGKRLFMKNFLIIPIINKAGKYRGFYSRSIEDKQFSTFLLPDTEKIWIQHPTQVPDIITEGIFDALSTGYDNPAAMLGAEVTPSYRDTLKEVVFAFDNDQTGTDKAIKYSQLGFKVLVWPEVQEKDLNEYMLNHGQEQTTDMIKQNIHVGIMAETRLRMKER